MTRRPDDANAAARPAGGPPRAATDESTGLPGFTRWRSVYAVVLGSFVLWVGLLCWLTLAYS